MTKMHTKYLGNLRTEIEHLQSKVKVITDAPLDNHGKGETFSPTDLFSSSLGSCMLTIIGITAQENNFSIEGTTIDIEKIMASDPRRVYEIKLDFHFPKNNYTQKEKDLIENAVHTCPVCNSVNPNIIQTITLNY